ncbi:hypothetical protein LTR36_008348 [Oleoguttula mirabilis]|uniref:Uncharacterized protein n=1 Tax=Oleoguttula mirabilis TaxID=1507867 RepID=A0AAV9J7R1_9PEZI|nr:hypothetical protein LTR36_008348 [Oleoguttula mirabilis]
MDLSRHFIFYSRLQADNPQMTNMDMDTEHSGLEILPPKLRLRYGKDQGHPKDVDDQHAVPTLSLPNDGFTETFDNTLFRQAEAGDAIIAAADLILIAHSNLNFANFSNPLSIKGVDNSAFSTAWSTSSGDSAFYALMRGSRVALVNLKLASHTGSEECGSPHLMVRIDDGWAEFSLWLSSLPLVQPKEYIGEEGYEMQYQWWCRNSKSFPLPDLPQDIFLDLLPILIGDAVQMGEMDVGQSDRRERFADMFRVDGYRPYGHTRLDDWGSYEHYDDPTTAPAIGAINLSVLQLNKAIRKLALKTLVESTTKVFDAPRHIPAHKISSLDPWIGNAMRTLHLNFSHMDFIRFFKVNIPPFVNLHQNRGDATAEVLAQLPHLNHLQLRFASTIDATANPWEMFRQCDRDHDAAAAAAAADSTLDGISWGRFPCQERLIDWIMCHAYAYLSSVRYVELLGYPKNCTKNKWEAILNSKRRSEHDASVSKQVEEIHSLPTTEIPPRCLCPRRCGFVDLNSLKHKCEDLANYHPDAEEIAPALHRYVFDFDDSMSDGRLQWQDGAPEDKEYRDWCYSRYCDFDGIGPDEDENVVD